MFRKYRHRMVERRALLGDPEHTGRVARRYGLTATGLAILVLSPSAYGLVRAGGAKLAGFDLGDMIMVGGAIIVIAVATGLAVQAAVHLLGREARKRRRR